MGRIVIVILNYINYEDTIACVNSALQQTYDDYQIIIVDNGSTNQSFRILSFIYGDCSKVTILRSKKNLGFARGNNIGIKYAKTKYHADYVFVCNSDIVFKEDLLETIAKVDYTGIGVISPSVYNLQGQPQTLTIATDHIYRKILSTIIGILINWINSPITSYLYHRINYNKWLSVKPPVVVDDGLKYTMQGCAYFLTPEFFRYYNQLYPKTFLYWEEINLLVYLEKVKLKAVLASTSPVLHKEKGSSNMVYHEQLNHS